MISHASVTPLFLTLPLLFPKAQPNLSILTPPLSTLNSPLSPLAAGDLQLFLKKIGSL